MIRKTFFLYYALQGLLWCGIGFIGPAYTPFLLSKGLSVFEAHLVNCFFYGGLLLFEIPTGIFADSFGRKRSYVLACFLYAVGMGWYGFSDTFSECVIAELFCALGITFASGAFNAWLVDTLKHYDYQGGTDSVFSRASMLRHALTLVCGSAGAYLAEVWLPYPWIVGSVFATFAGIMTILFLKDHHVPRATADTGAIWRGVTSVAMEGLAHVRENPHLRFVMVLGATFGCAVMSPNMQWQIFLREPGGDPLSALKYLYPAMMAALFFGGWLAPYLLRKMKYEYVLLRLCHLAIGVSLVLATVTGNLNVAIMCFLAHEIPRGVFRPIEDAYLHAHASSAARATVASIVSTSTYIGGGIGLVLGGLLAEYVSIEAAWAASGCLLIATAVMVRKP